MASKARVFPCNTCSITFTTSELQRSHMRQPWHVSNLRRRVGGLPAVSEEQYDIQAKSQEVIHRQKDNHEPGKKRVSSYDPAVEPEPVSERISEPACEISEKIPSTQCLFCNLDSPTLNASIDHMSSLHGLFIPSRNQLSDVESFLGYLATIIFEYKECLYCSLEKGTVDGVQTHMRDKGHCMIKMNAESELLDFWELSDSEEDGEDNDEKGTNSAAIKISETEMRLPSGIVINSRSDSTQLGIRPGLAQLRSRSLQHRVKRDELKTLTAAEDQETTGEKPAIPSRSHDRRVAVRGEMGLAGVTENQVRALQITEKKMKRREAVAKAAYRHAMEQAPVLTKYYKTENPVYQAG